MSKRFQEQFVYSAAVILFVTAVMKLLSTQIATTQLKHQDPLLFVSNRQIFYLAGGVELLLSAYLLIGQRTVLKLVLIAWLGTNLLVYHVALYWMGAPNACSCLGSFSTQFSISPRALDHALLAMLVWLLAGSYLFLALHWRERRKTSGRSQPSLRPEAAGLEQFTPK